MVHAQWKTPWAYNGPTGPEHWGDLDPEYAACKGRAQSPVDIRATVKENLPLLAFQYKSAPLKYLINNGKTIRVNYHDASGGDLFALGVRYHLTQFHFHRPAEDLVNGKQYEMVAHLMHESDDKKAAGVAVLIRAGHANETVRKLWDHMSPAEGPEREIPGVEVTAAGLLPPEFAYYTYRGSLSAPPCTEDVVWFVLKTPIELSRQQIAAFAKLYPDDIRPVQPLNGRIIRESK